MPPIATYQSTEDGKVTSKMLEYYGMRATGSNLAMIITEHSYIDIRGKTRKNQLSISSDEDIEGLKRLVESRILYVGIQEGVLICSVRSQIGDQNGSQSDF